MEDDSVVSTLVALDCSDEMEDDRDVSTLVAFDCSEEMEDDSVVSTLVALDCSEEMEDDSDVSTLVTLDCSDEMEVSTYVLFGTSVPITGVYEDEIELVPICKFPDKVPPLKGRVSPLTLYAIKFEWFSILPNGKVVPLKLDISHVVEVSL